MLTLSNINWYNLLTITALVVCLLGKRGCLLSSVVVCSGDEHSDCQSEHHGHVRVIRHAADRNGRRGGHSYVT